MASTILKLPVPAATDLADGPDAFGDLAQATEDYFYSRTLPSGITRMPSYHWGTGRPFPTDPGLRAGDSFFFTGVGLFRYNGTSWRQAETVSVADLAARNAIPPAVLHPGFRVYISAFAHEQYWDGARWQGTVSILHGVSTPLRFYSQITDNAMRWMVDRVAIPDYGFPYRLKGNLSVEVAGVRVDAWWYVRTTSAAIQTNPVDQNVNGIVQSIAGIYNGPSPNGGYNSYQRLTGFVGEPSGLVGPRWTSIGIVKAAGLEPASAGWSTTGYSAHVSFDVIPDPITPQVPGV